MRRLLPPLLAALALLCSPLLQAADASWAVGRWELVHDPDGGKTDWLEFTADGDAYNLWADGTRVPGFYVVTEQGVKAVFTVKGKDLIATFHADPAREELRIVTSTSGRPSVYRRRAD